MYNINLSLNINECICCNFTSVSLTSKLFPTRLHQSVPDVSVHVYCQYLVGKKKLKRVR